MTDPMSPEELRACRERADACFRAPWIASDPWTVEPDGDEDCEEVRSVLSPDECPGGQVVAECHDDGIIATPGLRGFAEAHSSFIAHARTDVPRLLATIAARDARLEAVGAVLSENGCDCDRDHHEEECDDDCDHGDRCLACRIEAAMKGATQP